MWRLVFVSVFASSAHAAFDGATIRWGGSARKIVLGPKAFLNRAVVPQDMVSLDRPDMLPSVMPHFIAHSDNTITWDSRCLEASGDQVRVNDCTGEALQKWKLLPDGQGRTMIQVMDSNKCLDITRKKGGLGGAPVELRNCDDRLTEKWQFEESIRVQTQGLATACSMRHALIALMAAFALGMLSLRSWLVRSRSKARAESEDHVCVSLVTPFTMHADRVTTHGMVAALMALSPTPADSEHDSEMPVASDNGALQLLLPRVRAVASKANANATRGVAGSRSIVSTAGKKARPTHFLSLRVGESVERAIAAVQEQMIQTARQDDEVGLEAMFEPCLVPSRKLHLSMLILVLPLPADVEAMKACMEEAVHQFREQRLEGISFELVGMENFSERVLYAKIHQQAWPTLQLFHQRLEDSCRQRGLSFVESRAKRSFRDKRGGQNAQASTIEGVSREPLSRFLTKVLRHQAENLKLDVRGDGSVELEALLALPFFGQRGYGVEDVEAEVAANAKQRFLLWTEDGVRRIRANQGHTMKCVIDDELLTPILTASDIPVCVHGTYLKRWDGNAKDHVMVWDRIKKLGLRPMGRNHIHFVPHEIGTRKVMSGMRADCTIAIYIDVARALEHGIQFFRSSNDVILTKGDGNGCVPSEFFQRVVEIRTGRLLWPETDCTEGADVAEHGQSSNCSSASGTDFSDVDDISDTSDDGVGDPPLNLFHPHVTIAKTSRARKSKNVRPRIPRRIWEPLRNIHLGTVAPETLELCEMKGDSETGYYRIVHAVRLT